MNAWNHARPILLLTLTIAVVVFAVQGRQPANAAEGITHEYIDPVPVFDFTQLVATSIPGCKIIHVSGQVASGNNHELQTENACRRILDRLEKVGATEADIVKLVVYIKDMDQQAVTEVKDGKAKVFVSQNQPAATWVGVTNLVSANALVEIEAVAIVGD